MSAGYIAVQSIHSAIDFIFKFPFLSYRWHKQSNYIACLSVKDESELISLIKKLEENNIRHSVFREPDLGNQITSVCVHPCEKSKKLCSGFPLALKEYSSKGLNKSSYKPKPLF